MSEYTNVTVNHSPGPDGDQSASRVITILTSRLEELQSNPGLAETDEEQAIVDHIQQNQAPQLSAEDLAIIERIKKYGPQDGKDLNYMEYYGIVVDTPVVPAEDIETKVEYKPITSPDIETSVKEVSEEDVTAQVENESEEEESTQSVKAEEGIVKPVNEHSVQHHVISYSSKVNVSANKSSNRNTKQSVTNNMTKNNETNVISYSVGGEESEDLIISPELEKSGENMDGYTFKHSPTEGIYLSTTEDNSVPQSDSYVDETVQQPAFSIQEVNPLATMSVAGFVPLVLGLVVKKFIN